MTDTNQLPEPELGYIKTDKSNQPAFSARQMREAMKHAPQARSQVQGEPVYQYRYADGSWSDQTRASYDYYVKIGATNVRVLYTQPQPAQATQAEVTDEQILEIAEPFGEFQYGDAQGHKRIDFARAILALRPERVPMTDEALWTAVIEHLGPEALSGGRMSIPDAFHLGITVAESHHGIKPQETP